jgi:uncharacterized protein (TIGR02996 family)
MARSRRKQPGDGKKRKSKPQPALPAPSEMEGAFLRDILDHPDDEARYLILADWLEEQGDSVSRDRAELIRTQCELARLEEEDPQYKALQKREVAVLERLKPTWLAPLERYGLEVEARMFSRGLFSTLYAASAEEFCNIDAPLFEAYPSLRGLTINTRIHMRQLPPGSPRAFVLVYPSLDVMTLTLAPCVDRVRDLSLINCNLGPEGMRILTAFPQVGSLTRLIVLDHQDRSGTGHMAEDKPLEDLGLAALASSPHFEQMRDLRLWFNRIGPKGARALAHSIHLNHLKVLTLGHNPLGDEGARALAEGPALAHLEELVLHSNGIGPQGAEALARSPYLTRLKKLVMGGQHVGQRGAALLRERFGTALDIDEESTQEPD